MTRSVRIVELAPAGPEASDSYAIAPSELVRLLQLSSPALPIGAFAYSQGLESAVELGFIDGEVSAREWLTGTLESGLVRLDLPLLARLYAAFRASDAGAVQRWSAYLLASRESAERREEDRQLGRALARLLADRGVPGALHWLECDSVTHACLFALAATHHGIRLEPTLLGFAFSWAENQVSALSRLVPLGQLAAQRVLSAVGEAVPAAVARARALGDGELGATLPGLALASAYHETQYTRLFKS